MHISFLVMAATLAMAGCASTGGGKLAVCDGKHLRPANLYGSVLAPTTNGAAPAAAGPDAAKPKTLSSNTPHASLGSC
jgi:hypothetical protein